MKILPGCRVREIAGEKMLIVKSEGTVDLTKVVMMNSTALYLFENLKDCEFSHTQAAELLQEGYGVDGQTALRDSGKWIDSLKDAGVILD